MDSSSRSRVRGLLLSGGAMFTAAALVTACTSSVPRLALGRSANTAQNLQAQYEEVVRAVLPSVVQINAGDSTGSGVVYDTGGDIVTNAHVVGDAKTVQVISAAGDPMLTGKVIGTFRPDDLAVVRVAQDAAKLKPARFANSADTQPGEIVLAMGSPLGLTDSVTQGIISATGRTVSEPSGGAALITAAIQTSAAINPGNSGGALVNLADEVVGIPTLAARLPDEGGAAPGIGFAIPSDTVMNIADQLIKNGKVTNSGRASLNIAAQTAANPSGEPIGVAVEAVAPGGSAAQAGLRPGDVIVGINSESTPTVESLEGKLAEFKPGDKITIQFRSGGSAQQSTETKLGSLGG